MNSSWPWETHKLHYSQIIEKNYLFLIFNLYFLIESKPHLIWSIWKEISAQVIFAGQFQLYINFCFQLSNSRSKSIHIIQKFYRNVDANLINIIPGIYTLLYDKNKVVKNREKRKGLLNIHENIAFTC